MMFSYCLNSAYTSFRFLVFFLRISIWQLILENMASLFPFTNLVCTIYLSRL